MEEPVQHNRVQVPFVHSPRFVLGGYVRGCLVRIQIPPFRQGYLVQIQNPPVRADSIFVNGRLLHILLQVVLLYQKAPSRP